MIRASPLSSAERREFRFDKGPKFTLFIEEEGIYVYSLQPAVKMILPSLVGGAVLSLFAILFALGFISIYQEIYVSLTGLILGTLLFSLPITKGMMLAKGTSAIDWEQSLGRKSFCGWDQVQEASLWSTLRKGRRILSIFLGSGLKRRSIIIVYDERQHEKLRLFLHEKIGDRLRP
jgi:hypothetical protein